MGQHERVGAHGRSLRRRDQEPVPDPLDVLDRAVAELDVVLLELAPPAVAQVRRLHPVMAEQPADALGDGVRRPRAALRPAGPPPTITASYGAVRQASSGWNGAVMSS